MTRQTSLNAPAWTPAGTAQPDGVGIRDQTLEGSPVGAGERLRREPPRGGGAGNPASPADLSKSWPAPRGPASPGAPTRHRPKQKRKEAERSGVARRGRGGGRALWLRGTRLPLCDFTGFATSLDLPRPTHPAARPPSALSPLSASLPPGLGLPRLSRSLRPAVR